MSDNRKIALLRGINVGGRNKVPMAELRELVAEPEFGAVATYIQSGDIVFTSDLDEPEVVAALDAGIEQRFGFFVPVVVRTASQLAAVAREHPLASPDSDGRLLMVAFLDRVPDVHIDDVIDAEDHHPDRFVAHGREVYLEYPDGSARSRLNHALLERRLRVRATVRNWSTVTKLVNLSVG